ncbi:MAG: galactokinase, partial [Bacteroidales bacterium]|nr:galactokinase [Bacteroidales bacterium]
MRDLYQAVLQEFKNRFEYIPRLFTAPGRINLIGEHTDYNMGYVLPAAIDKEIVFALHKNEKNVFRFYSLDYDEYIEFERLELKESAPLWSKYLIGTLAQFQEIDREISGFDCVFGGDIPLGAGLSSSAALECSFAYGINAISSYKIPAFDLVKMAQKAEHEYAGVKCGIMDQYASVFGRKGQVFLLDCLSNTHQYFPLQMDDYILALVDTKVKHSLASSEYNVRRKECENGVSYFQQFNSKITSLRQVSMKMIREHQANLDLITYKRCKYVIEENQRVLQATQALTEYNFELLGKLLYLSHEGLRNLYEVSCTELDFLVD